ncbi:MAG: hypothetical protein ACK51T_02715 [bacterium]
MNFRQTLLLASCLALPALTACTINPKPEGTPMMGKNLTAEETVDITVAAKVKAINYSTRQVTLVSADGRETSFRVGDQVQRLNEVKVGDNVQARFTASVVAELRAPTAQEIANPIAITRTQGRTPQGSTPGAGVIDAVRIVTQIQSVDVPNMLVTLRGPLGETATFKRTNPDRVRLLRAGDTVVLTYTQAVGVSLEKTAPR